MKHLLFLIPILALTLVIFAPSLNYGYVNWDDNAYLFENPLITSLDIQNIKKIFSTTVQNSYNPLTILSFAFDYHFFKHNSLIYHLHNILLHIINVTLIYFLALRFAIGQRAAALAALIFGIHPIHVESVVWISQRKDVLCTAFYLISLILYTEYIKTKNIKHFLYSMILGIFSILSKPMAYSLPLIFILLDIYHKRPLRVKTIMEKVPLALIIGMVIWVTLSKNTCYFSPANHTIQGALVFLWTSTFYIKKFFYPANLSPIYITPEPFSFSHAEYLQAAIVFLILILWMIKRWKSAIARFSLLFYFSTIILLIKFAPTHCLNGILVADRYMYLPSIGFCLFIGFLFDQVWSKAEQSSRAIKVTIQCGILFFFLSIGVSTQQLMPVWTNGLSFWSYIIEQHPGFYVAYNNRGTLFREYGHNTEAIKDFNQAIELTQNHDLIYYNRAIAYINQNNMIKAKQDLSHAKKIGLSTQKYQQALQYLNTKLEKQGIRPQ